MAINSGYEIFSLSLLLVFCFVTVGYAQTRQPDLMLIPDGYVGWIQVNYGVKGTPPLPNWRGFRFHKFGRDGEIRTSSPLTYGWAKDKIFYSTANGWKELATTALEGKGMIWGSGTGDGEIVSRDNKGKKTITRTPKTFTAFIGTWKQFHDTKTKRPQSQEEKAAFKTDK